MVSGIGTPDLKGGYGSFTLFTTSPRLTSGPMSGGSVVPVAFTDQKVITALGGPRNNLRRQKPIVTIPMEIWRDPVNAVARIQIQGKEWILNQGEWTDWIPLSFPLISPVSEIKGICKIYLQTVHPDFSMYVSPINIDPSDPVLPIISSDKYIQDLKTHIGPFYTQGLPADTKALSNHVLNDREYLDLEQQIWEERKRLLEYELECFSKQKTAFLFFYISTLDQNMHMFWRTHDPGHPLYDPDFKKTFGSVLMNMYMEMDLALGNILDRFDIHDPDFRLMVMSDHGFAPFRRQVNVNTWLFENGYIDFLEGHRIPSDDYFTGVNWERTAAYSVGINAVYLNLQGREKFGVISESQSKTILAQIKKGLLDLRDPKNGRKTVSKIRLVSPQVKQLNSFAPDLIIGWNQGYRTAWNSILGGFSENVIFDNMDKWSGDHCIDPDLVPALLFCNKKIQKAKPDLLDITATILEEYHITRPAFYEGLPLYQV